MWHIKIQMLYPGQLIRTLFTDPFYCFVLLTVRIYTKDKDWEQPHTREPLLSDLTVVSQSDRLTLADLSTTDCTFFWDLASVLSVFVSELLSFPYEIPSLCFHRVSLLSCSEGIVAQKREFYTKKTMPLEDTHFICLFQAPEAYYFSVGLRRDCFMDKNSFNVHIL